MANSLKLGLVSVVALLLASAGCVSTQSFDARLDSITRPYQFSTVRWAASYFWEGAKDIFQKNQGTDDGSQVVNYFSSVQRMRSLASQIGAMTASQKPGDLASFEAEVSRLRQQTSSSQTPVEETIRKEIIETLSQQGIFNPLDRYLGLRVIFPPLNFDLAEPPHVLVISPRDRVEEIRSITLQQGLTLEEMEDIEARADQLGVSSLVVELGGFAGTYPVFVTNRSGLSFAIETAIHEWLHQYLAFTPLGFAYLLDLTGLSPNYEVATLNETVASMTSKEIAAIVLERYHGQKPQGRAPVDSVFSREMRDIRRTVDQYLAKGEVEAAEEYMEQRRQYLSSQGYYVRRLNQAYFAFHGTYADSPTSVNPIGSELAKLRSQERSAKDFLEAVSVMTTRQDVINSLK